MLVAAPIRCARRMRLEGTARRGGRVVDRAALEMRSARKRTGGSNPSLSASLCVAFGGLLGAIPVKHLPAFPLAKEPLGAGWLGKFNQVVTPLVNPPMVTPAKAARLSSHRA